MMRRTEPQRITGRSAALLSTVVFLFGFAALARAAELPPGDPAFATHLHADDQTFFVLEDPIPHLRAFLTHPVVRKAAGLGAISDWLKGSKDHAPDPLEIWNFLNDHKLWVPPQIAVGISEAGFGDLDHLARAAAMYQLIDAGASHRPDDNPALAAELRVLRQAFLAELKQAKFPRLRVIARFRTEQEAADLLSWFQGHVKDADPKDLYDGLKFDLPDSAVVAHFSLSDAIGNDEQAARLLEAIKLTDPDDGNFNAQLIAAARQLTAEASIHRTGATIVLTLGPADAGGVAGLSSRYLALPPAVGGVDLSTIAWGRWDIRRLKDAARGWITLRRDWARSNCYALAAESETSDRPLVDELHAAGGWISRLGGTGTARLWVDHEGAGAVRLSAQAEPMPVVAELSQTPIAKFIPASAEGFIADASQNLGEFVSAAVGRAEDHIAAHLFAPVEHPNAVNTPRLVSGYYAYFAEFRELLHRTPPEKFESGVACVMGTQGKIDRLEAAVEVHGRAQRWSGRELPSMEIALIGQPKVPADPEAMKKLAEELFASATTGFRLAMRPKPDDRPLPPVTATARPVDLGLGIPTWGFSAESLTAATGEAKLRLALEGDLHPHFFFLDGCVIISTSPRLSKTLIAARDGKSPRAALAGPAGEGRSVTSGKVTGAALATLADHAGAWYAMIADNLDKAANTPIPAAEQTHVESILSLAGQLARLADRVEWRTSQAADRPAQVTQGGIYFAAEK